jgi:hypothetical protein
MTGEEVPRRARPVGRIEDLDLVSAGAVRCLRLWCDPLVVRDRIAVDFAAALGPQAGQGAVATRDHLCEGLVCHARRPLLRHDGACPCLGTDEACFAPVVSAAAERAREDAIRLAILIVRPDMAFALVGHAAQLGLALRRMGLRDQAGLVGYRLLH